MRLKNNHLIEIEEKSFLVSEQNYYYC